MRKIDLTFGWAGLFLFIVTTIEITVTVIEIIVNKSIGIPPLRVQPLSTAPYTVLIIPQVLTKVNYFSKSYSEIYTLLMN